MDWEAGEWDSVTAGFPQSIGAGNSHETILKHNNDTYNIKYIDHLLNTQKNIHAHSTATALPQSHPQRQRQRHRCSCSETVAVPLSPAEVSV